MIVEEIKYQYTNYMNTATRGDKIRLWLFIGSAIMIVGTIWVAFPIMYQLAQGSEGKGLKVNLEVNTNLRSQDVRIETFQFGNDIHFMNGFMNNGITTFKLQYPNGVIENGESFQICVVAVTDNLQSCGNGYNSEAKKPENVRVDIISSNTPQPQPDQSQSQSQSSNNENNNANSQSQSTTIYICNDKGCRIQ